MIDIVGIGQSHCPDQRSIRWICDIPVGILILVLRFNKFSVHIIIQYNDIILITSFVHFDVVSAHYDSLYIYYMAADAYSTGAVPFDMGNLGFVVESDVSTGRSFRLDPKYSDVTIMKYQ